MHRAPESDTAARLEAAIRAAPDASGRMLHTARAAAAAAEAECSAAAGLRDILALRTGTTQPGSGVGNTAQLAGAIEAAARFPRLRVRGRKQGWGKYVGIVWLGSV